MRGFWVAVAGVCILVSCGEGMDAGHEAVLDHAPDVAVPPDAGPDDLGYVAQDATDGSPEAPDTVAPDAPFPPPDLSERLAKGQVRAGRVSKEADLIGGRTAKGRLGDYKIYNSKVAFIVQDAGLASGYKRYGGVVVDADVVRPEGDPGRSQMGEMFFGFSLRLFEPLEVEVASDGSDGRAVIRVKGRDGLFPWLSSFLGDLVPRDPIGCELVYEYSLGPDDDFLTLDIHVSNTTGGTLDLAMQVAFIMGDGLKTHFPGPGFDASAHQGEYPHWAALGDAVTYGMLAAEAPIQMAFNYSNVAFGFYPNVVVPAGETRTLRRYLAVTAGGLDEVTRILRDIGTGEETGVLTGFVEADPEALALGVRVHVLSAKGDHLSVIRLGPDSRFYANLKPGTYRLIAKADGFDPSPEVVATVIAGQESYISLTVPPSTPFEYLVTYDGQTPEPARLSFFRKDSPPSNILPAKFGEESHPIGAALVVFSATGKGEGFIPRGTYEVFATRGPLCERDHVLVNAGDQPLFLALRAEKVVDSSGYLATDAHIHAEHSPDSNVFEDVRVRTALADGLDIPILTEHDVIYDLAGATAAVPGAPDLVQFIAGSEVTTYMYGHFNAFPLTPKPHLINNGGIEWFDTWAPDLFRRIRESEDHPVVIQVNHPRGANIASYFSAVGLDREMGTVREWGNWSDDFDAIEVFNGGCYNGDTEALRDWFDFLNRGYRVSVSSGSDTHSDHGIGFPRVYVPTPHSPADFDPQEVVQAYRDLTVFVSCGAFVAFDINGVGPGGTLTEPGPLQAFVEVQAPSWMSFYDLRILRNGVEVFSLPAADWIPGEGAVRFQGVVGLSWTEADAWFVLEVRGTGDLWPLHWDAPYAITNPVFVDVDGTGEFDAPLPAYQPPR